MNIISKWMKIVVFVPETHANQIRSVAALAGAGKIGKYSCCSFSTKGMGRFLPEEKSEPWIGNRDQVEEIIEERIEMLCEEIHIERILREISKAHPYEEPVIDVYPIYQRDVYEQIKSSTD
ncbi:MAG: hypothetical protein ACRCU0_02395 [Candidatus Rhabdochlamydia sp.]